MLNIAVVLLLINLFRMPIIAIFKIQQFGFYFHVLILAAPLFLKDNFSNFKIPRPIYIIWALVGAISFLVLLKIGVEKNFLKSQVLPFVIPCFFPAYLDLLNINTGRLKQFFERIALYTFYAGSIYIIVEYFAIHGIQLTSQCDYTAWFFGEKSSQYCNTMRKMPIGFLVYKDFSLSLILATFFSLKPKELKFKLLNISLVIVNMILVDSITLSFVFLAVITLKHIKFIKENIKTSLLIILILMNIFSFTPTFQRIFGYLLAELNLSTFLPILNGFQFENLFFTKNGIGEFYNSQEFHSLFYLFRYGVLASIGWYSFWILSSIFIIKEIYLKNGLNSRLLFNAVFLLSGLHYSGAETWGVNLLFCIVVFIQIEYYLRKEVILPR
jgi:hypothetical protein